eukprot:353916-Chlamydomonas_euryale.AAC.3
MSTAAPSIARSTRASTFLGGGRGGPAAWVSRPMHRSIRGHLRRPRSPTVVHPRPLAGRGGSGAGGASAR